MIFKNWKDLRVLHECGFSRDDELIKSNFQVMHQKMSIINSVIFINNSIIFIVFFFFLVKKENCQNDTFLCL